MRILRRATVLIAVLCLLAPADAGRALAGGPEAVAPHKERTHLFGDWGGVRTKLAEHGIIVDIQVTQFYQSVVDGSAGTDDWQYGVKADYFITLLGEKLGLWKGFNVSIHGETRGGEDVNAISGVSPANTTLLTPAPKSITAITGVLVSQMLGEQAMLVGGKINGLDLFDMLFHSGRGVDKFMNASMVIPLGLARTLPLAFLGGGIMKLKGREVQGALAVYDPTNCLTNSCLGSPFNQGAAVIGLWKFFHDSRHGGRAGYISIGGSYSGRQYTVVDRASLAVIPGQGLALTKTDDSWSLFSVINHQLWADPSNPSRDLRFNGQFTVSDGQANPIKWSASVALEMSGLIPGRDKDTFGVGYFHNELSNGAKDTVGPLLSLAATLVNGTPTRIAIEDTDGFEAYYKAQITPWFAVTGDVQVITETLSNQDTKVVAGIRGKIDL